MLAGEAAYRLGLAYIKMSDAKIALTVCGAPDNIAAGAEGLNVSTCE